MNLTLSVDERLVERAREVARKQGTSLNALIREFIERLAGRRSGSQLARDILRLLEEHPGSSRGRRIRREDAYAGRR
jgi:hypothetical protein